MYEKTLKPYRTTGLFGNPGAIREILVFRPSLRPRAKKTAFSPQSDVWPCRGRRSRQHPKKNFFHGMIFFFVLRVKKSGRFRSFGRAFQKSIGPIRKQWFPREVSVHSKVKNVQKKIPVGIFRASQLVDEI